MINGNPVNWAATVYALLKHLAKLIGKINYLPYNDESLRLIIKTSLGGPRSSSHHLPWWKHVPWSFARHVTKSILIFKSAHLWRGNMMMHQVSWMIMMVFSTFIKNRIIRTTILGITFLEMIWSEQHSCFLLVVNGLSDVVVSEVCGRYSMVYILNFPLVSVFCIQLFPSMSLSFPLSSSCDPLHYLALLPLF